MGRLDLPITDYVGDTKSALDNSVRILQAITDVAADAGWLRTTLATMRIIQGLMQVTAPAHCLQDFVGNSGYARQGAVLGSMHDVAQLVSCGLVTGRTFPVQAVHSAEQVAPDGQALYTLYSVADRNL